MVKKGKAVNYLRSGSYHKAMKNMAVSEKTMKALRDIGLTEYERTAYLFLLTSGPRTANQISKSSGLPYSKIYDILTSLEEKGWTEVKHDRPKRYYPKPPSEALEAMKMQFENTLSNNVSQILTELKPLYEEKEIQERPDIWIVRGEFNILARFASRVREADPDFLVVNDCDKTLRYVFERAKILDMNIQLGRDLVRNYNLKDFSSAIRGRAVVDLSDFHEYGVAGISELSRFTLAPPSFSAKWPAGKTIDARQSHEALKKDILVPKRRGFPKFTMTALEIHKKDKGGLLFSPVVGLHENVAELDFESMFPNIIINHNISY